MTTLGTLAADRHIYFSDGYRTRRDQLANDGYRVLRVADVQHGWISFNGADFVDRSLVRQMGQKVARDGDILITTKGTIGRVAAVSGLDGRMVVYSPQLCFFRVAEDGPLERTYFRYWLSSPEARRQIAMYSGNTDMAPYLSLRDVAALHLVLPPVPTQRAIAEVLGALDDKIAANRRLIAKADELMGAWVRPHLVERRRLWDAVQFVFGEAFKGEAFSPEGSGRPLIRIRDLKSQLCQVWTTESRQRERMVTPGEVLVGMDAEFRASRWSGRAGLLNQRVLLARSDQYGDALVRELVRAPLSRVERSKSGTTVIHLNKRDLQEEFVAVPKPSKVAELRLLVDPLWQRCIAAEQEVTMLATTRDELLPLLMNGRITVKDAERRVESEV